MVNETHQVKATTMTQPPISCELHDYLEIACLYGYQIRLTLKNGQLVEGKAIDTLTSTDKREYLVIENEQKQPIETREIQNLQVLTPNAKFSEVVFGD